MNRTLHVYLNQQFAGLYSQDQHGRINFRYADTYLKDTHAIALSKTLPLQAEVFEHNVCHSFFAGMLPEAGQRRLIARNLGISANNDFSLLDKIGGECAGAISFFAAEQLPTEINVTNSDYQEISTANLQEILTELPTSPLLAGKHEIRLSLAGVQDKMTVAIVNGKMYLPLHGAPSTHILKPELGYQISTVSNEAFCLKLAKAIGINAVDCEIANAAEHRFLLVKRYDREPAIPELLNIRRIHQEDFCQALAIEPEKKYQAEGGPGLIDCFTLVRENSSMPIYDIPALLDAVIYNYIIGNCDAHGKNFSLLYQDNQSIRLAPLYDLLSTTAYTELSTKMAMRLGAEYAINKITAKHFIQFASKTGLNKTLVLARLVEMASAIIINIDKVESDDASAKQIKDIIMERARKIIASN